jgi:ribosomal protein L17
MRHPNIKCEKKNKKSPRRRKLLLFARKNLSKLSLHEMIEKLNNRYHNRFSGYLYVYKSINIFL